MKVVGKTDLERFACLERAWNKALSNLVELGKEHILDNDHILNRLASKFTMSSTCQMYAVKKISSDMNGMSELEIMKAFMTE